MPTPMVWRCTIRFGLMVFSRGIGSGFLEVVMEMCFRVEGCGWKFLWCFFLWY